MNTREAIVALSLVVLQSSVTGAQPGQQPHGPLTEIIEEDGRRPPATLGALARASDVVAVVRVTSATSADKDGPMGGIETRFVMTVERFAAGTSPYQPGDTITVLRPTGTTATRRSVSASIPQFEVGQRYLLFLKARPEQDTFVLNYGAAGMFRVLADGNVEPTRTLPDVAASVKGRSANSIVRELQSAAP